MAYRKFRHPASGYAVVAAAVVLDIEAGQCSGGRIAVTGFADHVFLASKAEPLLRDYAGREDETVRLLDAAFADAVPLEDRFADAEYRQQLGRTMLRRALADALPA